MKVKHPERTLTVAEEDDFPIFKRLKRREISSEVSKAKYFSVRTALTPMLTILYYRSLTMKWNLVQSNNVKIIRSASAAMLSVPSWISLNFGGSPVIHSYLLRFVHFCLFLQLVHQLKDCSQLRHYQCWVRKPQLVALCSNQKLCYVLIVHLFRFKYLKYVYC